ncbi:MAG: CBS domain-containing protein [Ignavibacteria bacterium]|nr:CBS domain-containing protein [Ignavibacteria bacterium]
MKSIPKVSDIMSKDLFVVSWEEPLRKVLDYIASEKIRHVPVVEKGKFVGIISNTTLNEYIRKRIYDPDEEVEEAEFSTISDFDYLVERNVTRLFPNDSLVKAIEIFLKKKADCLPVVDEDENLIGIVSYIDLLLYFYKSLLEQQN